MGLLGSILRLQLLLAIGSSFWVLATADKRILLDPEYSLHERPPTQEGEPLLIQVCSLKRTKGPYTIHMYQTSINLHEHVQFPGEHQPAQHPGGVGEGAVGQP